MITINRLTVLCVLFGFFLMYGERPHQTCIVVPEFGDSNNREVINYVEEYIPFPVVVCNYPKIFGWFNQEKREITILKEKIEQFIAYYDKDCKIVLYGISRGANVVINFLKKFNEFDSYINAIVLDSQYGHMTIFSPGKTGKLNSI